MAAEVHKYLVDVKPLLVSAREHQASQSRISYKCNMRRDYEIVLTRTYITQ